MDRIPVQELQARYDIKQSAVYARLERLSIKPQKDGRRAYITSEQLEILDRLDAHIKRGGNIDDFVAELSSTRTLLENSSPDAKGDSMEHFSRNPMASVQPETDHSTSLAQVDQQAAIAAFLQALMPPSGSLTIQLAPAPDRFAYYRILEEATAKAWELMTSEVAELLSLSGSTVRGYGTTFAQAGFVFTRTGNKRRGEVCWSVSKPKKGKHH